MANLPDQEEICDTELLRSLNTRDWRALDRLITTGTIEDEINLQDVEGRTPLHVAIVNTHYELLPVLVRNGADVNVTDGCGRTPLFMAALGHTMADGLFRLLISTSNINCADQSGNTPLHAAIEMDHTKVLPWLIQHGADIDVMNNMGLAPLHCRRFDKWLMPQDNQEVNRQSVMGKTPLHSALLTERWDLVDDLTNRLCDLNLVDDEGCTPLHTAVSMGAPRHVIQNLITPTNINKLDKCGHTALHKAATGEHWELLSVLVIGGADINIRESKCGLTALHECVSIGIPANELGCVVSAKNINMQDDHGQTPLHEAVIMQRWHLVDSLIQYGADLNAFEYELNRTPLHLAILVGTPTSVIEKLICPENINMQDSAGCTPLLLAVEDEVWCMIPEFIKRGAHIKIKDNALYTPLHPACIVNVPVQYLTQLICGATINAQDYDGNTPLHLALKNKHWKLVPLLLNYGADIHITDYKMNQTPLHVACRQEAPPPENVIRELVSPKNFEMRDTEGKTPLNLLIQGGHKAAARELLEIRSSWSKIATNNKKNIWIGKRNAYYRNQIIKLSESNCKQ